MKGMTRTLLPGLVAVALLVTGCSASGSGRSPHRATPAAEPSLGHGVRHATPARLLRPQHNRYGIYYRPTSLGRCYGPKYHQPEFGLQYSDYGAEARRAPVVLSYRDVTDALPEPITPFKIVVIAPSGHAYSAVMAIRRGNKATPGNSGQQITFPEDFYSRGGGQPAMQRGVYTVLLFTASGHLQLCQGFVSKR